MHHTSICCLLLLVRFGLKQTTSEANGSYRSDDNATNEAGEDMFVAKVAHFRKNEVAGAPFWPPLGCGKDTERRAELTKRM